MMRKKFIEWIVIITMFMSCAFGYGSLNNQVKVNSTSIERIEVKLDDIHGLVQQIDGYLIKKYEEK